MPRKRDRQDRIVGRRARRPKAKVILVPELVGVVLSLHRARAELRQQDVADALNWPQSMVSKLERGDLNISVDQLDALTEVIDEGLADLGKGRLQAWMVLRRVEELADELQDEGYDLVWSTAPTWSEPAKPIRGRKLREMVLDRL
jgi:transcriptional regulator with XRE-family HTH domain